MALRSTIVYPLGTIAVQMGAPENLALLRAHDEPGLIVALVVASGDHDEPIEPAKFSGRVGVAARVHEIGLAIAHSQHHQHASYVLANSDMAGFTRLEQQVLATIVRGHRRGIPVNALKSIPARAAPQAERLMILLRLAALLHRSRVDERVPKLGIEGSDRGLKLTLPEKWLQSHPLTSTDLDQERDYLAAIDFRLTVRAA